VVNRRAGHVFAGLLVGLLGSCKFTEEVVVPPSDPFLIVHGVLNPRATRQFVTVERSGGDRVVPGDPAVRGATVQLTHLDPVNCAKPAVRLVETAPEPGLPGPGIYVTENLCPLRPGNRVALRIDTPDGKVVTGTTRIPGARSITVTGGPFASFQPPTGTIPLDRTRDSIHIAAEPVFARAMQVEAVRNDMGAFTTFRLTVDTMGMVIAGDLVDPFDGDGRTVFRAGAYYLLTVALTDTNYYDFTRSGSDPFTGRGFINHLTGAVGVFGSVATATYKLWVVAPLTDPREGTYIITGELGGQTISFSWELYRDALSLGGDGFSGFVGGRLPGVGVVSTSADVIMRSGRFEGMIFEEPPDPSAPDPAGGSVRFTGQRAPEGQPFDLQVTYSRNGTTIVGTLTAVQVPRPH
jgi:hypothetical protein